MNFGGAFEEGDYSRAGLVDRAQIPFFDAVGEALSETWAWNPNQEMASSLDMMLAEHPEARLPARILGAAAGLMPTAGLTYGPIAALRNAGPTDAGAADRFVDPKSLNKLYGDSLGLSFDKPMRKGAVDILVANKTEQLRREQMLARAPDGVAFGATHLLTSLAVSAVDPLNVAASFVPVVGEARYGIWAARAGRTVARAARGGIEGGVGMAALQPIEAAHSAQFQDEYGPMDAFLNVAFGSVLGGGLHLGLGAFSDLLARARPETREAALRTAVAQAAEGRPVDVEAPLATDPAFASTPEPQVPEGSRVIPQDMLDSARADVEIGRSPMPKPDRSLFETIRQAGGIRTKDAQGNVTREGGEVRNILKDTKRPGLINNKGGHPPNELRGLLKEGGWFGVRPEDGADLQHLYDALDTEANREPVFHQQSEAAGEIASRRELEHQFDQAGITKKDTPEAASEKLAQWRHDYLTEHLGELRTRADKLGIPYRGETTHEDLLASVTEREAIKADGQGLDALENEIDRYLAARFGSTIPAEGSYGARQVGEIPPQAGEFAGAGGPSEDAGAQGGAGQHGARPSGDRAGAGAVDQARVTEAIDRARTASEAFGRNEDRRTEFPAPEKSAVTGAGDDLEAELKAALDQVDEYEKQGIFTAEEAAAARSGSEDIAKAKQRGDAAKAAARCLLLHP